MLSSSGSLYFPVSLIVARNGTAAAATSFSVSSILANGSAAGLSFPSLKLNVNSPVNFTSAGRTNAVVHPYFGGGPFLRSNPDQSHAVRRGPPVNTFSPTARYTARMRKWCQYGSLFMIDPRSSPSRLDMGKPNVASWTACLPSSLLTMACPRSTAEPSGRGMKGVRADSASANMAGLRGGHTREGIAFSPRDPPRTLTLLPACDNRGEGGMQTVDVTP